MTASFSILEEVRQRYRFVVVGYVVMPEHFHLLITEPQIGSTSTVMQVLKQRTARALLPKVRRRTPRQGKTLGEESRPRAFWQARFYDFNVWTSKKRIEKLRYMHRNPVKRGLAASPEQWRWSSYPFYLLGEAGMVSVNVGWGRIWFGDHGAWEGKPLLHTSAVPALARNARTGHPLCGGVGDGGLGHSPLSHFIWRIVLGASRDQIDFLPASVY